MLSLSSRVGSAAVLGLLACSLGGCITGTEVSYNEYQYDRYGGTEREYEHSIYSDPTTGTESETCRTVVKRRVDSFGDEVVRRNRVCDPPGQASTGEPWLRQAVPQNAYPDPVEPLSPPADVPDTGEAEVDPG